MAPASEHPHAAGFLTGTTDRLSCTAAAWLGWIPHRSVWSWPMLNGGINTSQTRWMAQPVSPHNICFSCFPSEVTTESYRRMVPPLRLPSCLSAPRLAAKWHPCKFLFQLLCSPALQKAHHTHSSFFLQNLNINTLVLKPSRKIAANGWSSNNTSTDLQSLMSIAECFCSFLNHSNSCFKWMYSSPSF